MGFRDLSLTVCVTLTVGDQRRTLVYQSFGKHWTDILPEDDIRSVSWNAETPLRYDTADPR